MFRWIIHKCLKSLIVPVVRYIRWAFTTQGLRSLIKVLTQIRRWELNSIVTNTYITSSFAAAATNVSEVQERTNRRLSLKELSMATLLVMEFCFGTVTSSVFTCNIMTETLNLISRGRAYISLKFRSSFLSTKHASLGANLAPKSFSEMTPRFLYRISNVFKLTAVD